MDCTTAIDINTEAAKLNVTPELLASNGKTGDARLIVWRVGDVEVIETNGDSVWEDTPGFTELRAEVLAPAYDLPAMLADVARQVGDDGTGDLGIIVRQALADDPAATVDDIVTIVREAREDAARERVAGY